MGCEERATQGYGWRGDQPQRGLRLTPKRIVHPAYKSPKFVWKRHLPVMLLLAGDVFPDLFQIRAADGEVRVTPLPLEVGKNPRLAPLTTGWKLASVL